MMRLIWSCVMITVLSACDNSQTTDQGSVQKSEDDKEEAREY